MAGRFFRDFFFFLWKCAVTQHICCDSGSLSPDLEEKNVGSTRSYASCMIFINEAQTSRDCLQPEYFMLNHYCACHYLSVSSHSLGCAHYTNPLFSAQQLKRAGEIRAINEKRWTSLKFRSVPANIVYVLFTCNSVGVLSGRISGHQIFLIFHQLCDYGITPQNPPPARSQAVSHQHLRALDLQRFL